MVIALQAAPIRALIWFEDSLCLDAQPIGSSDLSASVTLSIYILTISLRNAQDLSKKGRLSESAAARGLDSTALRFNHIQKVKAS